MKESLWIYLLLGLGIFIIVGMMLIQDLTSTSEEDFYLTKEVMEAAMIDAVDMGLYNQTGEIRIIESVFVENFIRRFAESVNNSKTYNIKFYEIYEFPPKATVLISTKSRSVKITADSETDFDILTTLSGVLETKPDVYTPTTTETSALLEQINNQQTENTEETTNPIVVDEQLVNYDTNTILLEVRLFQ